MPTMPKYVTRAGRLTNTHLLAPNSTSGESLGTLCGLRLPFEAKVGRLKITESIPKGKRECERCKARDGRPSPVRVRSRRPHPDAPGWVILSQENSGDYAIQSEHGAQRWNVGATRQHIATPALTFAEFLLVLEAAEQKVADVLAARSRR